MKKSLFLILFSILAIFMVTGCGEESSNNNTVNNGGSAGDNNTGNDGNIGNDGNTGSSEVMLNTIYGGAWKPGGISFGSEYVALKIKDKEIVTDMCGEQLAINNVRNETGTIIKYSYRIEGNVYIITGVTNGKNDKLKLHKLYMEKGKLVFIGQDGRKYAELDVVSSASDAENIAYIVSEINKYRQEKGLNPLGDQTKHGGCLKSVADIRVKEIKEKFQHERPDGRPFETVFSEVNSCKYAGPSAKGENLAEQSSAQKAMEGWKASPGHNANMLSTNYNTIGVSVSGKHYVIIFGRY